MATQQGRAIIAGYEWRQRLTVTSPLGVPVALFPADAVLVAHVRESVEAATTLAVLGTATGGIVRINDSTIEIVLTAAQTAAIVTATVVLDVVRTDTGSPQHLGFMMRPTVEKPVTRGIV